MFSYKLVIIFLSIGSTECISTELGIKVKVDPCSPDQYVFVARRVNDLSGTNFECSQWTLFIGNVSELDVQNFTQEKYKLYNEDVQVVSVKQGASAFFDIDNAYICWSHSRRNNFNPGAFTFFTVGPVKMTNVCLKHVNTKQLVTCSQSLTTCRSSINQSKNRFSCLAGSIKTKFYEPLQPEFKFEAQENGGYFISYETNDIPFYFQSNCVLTPSILTSIICKFIQVLSGTPRDLKILDTIDWSYFDQYIDLQMIESGLKADVVEKWKFECHMDQKCTYHGGPTNNNDFEWFELHNYPSNTSLVMFPENEALFADHQAALGFHFIKNTDRSILTSALLIVDLEGNNISISFNYELSNNVSFQICLLDGQSSEILTCSQMFETTPKNDMGLAQVNFAPRSTAFRLQFKFYSENDGGIVLLSRFSTNGFKTKVPEPDIIRPTLPPCHEDRVIDGKLFHCLADPTNCDQYHGFPTWYFSRADNACKPNLSCVNVWLKNAFSTQEACENYCLDRFYQYIARQQPCQER